MDRDDAMEAAKAVERGDLPSGSVILAVTGPRSMATPGEVPGAQDYRAALFNAPTGNRYQDAPFARLNNVLIRDDDPDPIRRNVARGLRAGLLVRKYERKYAKHEPNQQVLSDFLCDLLHACDMTDTDFDEALERARRHHNTEVAGQ